MSPEGGQGHRKLGPVGRGVSDKTYAYTTRREESNERSLISLFCNSRTLSFRMPSAWVERNTTICSSFATRLTRQMIQHGQHWLMTYAHLAVIERVNVLKRVDSCGLSPYCHRENDLAMR